MLNVAYMKLRDQVLMDHLRENAVEREVHVVYQKLADDLQCGRNTVYRSVNRLRSTGHLEIKAGNNRLGYTYHIKD